MYFVLKTAFVLAVVFLGLAFARTWQVENSENQKIMERSSAPSKPLEGFYEGTVSLPVKVTWTGKKFSAANSNGINVFEDGVDRFPFKTAVGTVGSSTVLNISYDLPENPFWIRIITDQLVETGPNRYLGKMTAHILPGFPFSLGFFRLSY